MKAIESKIKEKLMNIHEQDIEIQKLKSKRQKDFDSLNLGLKELGLTIVRCKHCHGMGEVSYTYGYQDCSTGWQECDNCEGSGYAVSELVEKESKK